MSRKWLKRVCVILMAFAVVIGGGMMLLPVIFGSGIEAKAAQASDYVRCRKSKTFVYKNEYNSHDLYVTIRIPEITLNSQDARNANAAINSRLDSLYDTCENAVIYDYSVDVKDIDYKIYLNKNILSLEIITQWMNNNFVTYIVYNFDVTTGKLLSNNDIGSYLGYTSQELKSALYNSLVTESDERLAYFLSPSYPDNDNKEHARKARQKTLSAENVNQSALYLRSNNQLRSVLTVYHIAGGEVAFVDTALNVQKQVTLNKTSLSLEAGASSTVTASQLSAWTTSNSSVATVNSSGRVTAAGVGSAVITARAANGTTASCTVYVYSALKNNCTVSSTTITANNTITLTGKASGGKAPYTYSYYYRRSSASDWTKIAGYSTATSRSFTPSSAGTYIVRVNVKDSNGKICQRDFAVTVMAALKNSSAISATRAEVNQKIVLTGKASGGKAPYTYAYSYRKTTVSDWTMMTSYCSSTSKSFCPASSGIYVLRVYVKDSAGNIVIKDNTVTVREILKNTSTISTSKAIINTSVKLTGKASGGFSPYTYAFYYKKSGDSSWSKLAGYSTAASKSFTPRAAGAYVLRVNVKDSTGKSVFKDINLTVRPVLKNTSSISTTKTYTNTSVKLTGKASGGFSPYTYAFYYKKSGDSSWSKLAGYSTAASKSFTPRAAGAYVLRVNVKDSTGKSVCKDINLTVRSVLKNTSSISTTKTIVNTPVKLAGKASGGFSPYTYAYYYKKSDESSWTKLAGYSTAASKSFTSRAAGAYVLRVNVKDSTGKSVCKDINLTVRSVLKNTSSISTTKTIVNTPVKLAGKASGGFSPYTYSYYYKKSGDRSWTNIAGYSTAALKTFKPTTAGTYILRVNVKDNTGKFVGKDFTLMVTK